MALGLFEPSTVMADLVANGDELTQVMVESGAALGSFALGTLQVCAWVFSGLTLPFVWMITEGAARMKAGKRMAGCADLAEEFDYKKGISWRCWPTCSTRKSRRPSSSCSVISGKAG
ncbi:hypothetical protein [Faecalibacterium sp. OF04-11AC]|uniref:hypothetical protein n=1 Tax=Faecalibacterium sp. OF04-11AC TaxID=2293109 RepID=UPI001FA866FF|nr:hypothetical protein [Faecalibacterium sp. OF04-11AC]